jgi:hypothetical protein
VVAVARELAGFLVGRDAGLSPHAVAPGAVTDRRDRTRQPQQPVGAPPTQTRSPRPYGHAHCGATHQVWGYGLRRADLRSRPANISVAVRRSTPLRRGPGLPRPGHLPARQHNREQQELLTGGSHLTAPFHIRRSSASGTASATSPTTGCGCSCTAASGGRLTEPQDYEAVPYAWWEQRRRGDPTQPCRGEPSQPRCRRRATARPIPAPMLGPCRAG